VADKPSEQAGGGVGLKDLTTLNTSLLLKHVHKLFTGKVNPWADWIRLWYDGRHTDDDTPSWSFFKSLIPRYRGLTAVALGDGTTTSFWHDEWAEASRLAELLPALYSHCLDTDATVEEVLTAGGVTFYQLQPRLSAAAQHELTLLETALLAVELKACPDGAHGRFRPRARLHDGVLLGTAGAGRLPPMADINWQGFAPKKVKVFFWALRHGRTRTRATLHRHGAIDTSDCPFCAGAEEDARHLFTYCPRHQVLWERLLPECAPLSGVQDAAESIAGLFSSSPAGLGHMATLGVKWKTRNRQVFDGITVAPAVIATLLEEHLKLWVCRASQKIDAQPLLKGCYVNLFSRLALALLTPLL
jgi:hypothetical protein